MLLPAIYVSPHSEKCPARWSRVFFIGGNGDSSSPGSSDAGRTHGDDNGNHECIIIKISVMRLLPSIVNRIATDYNRSMRMYNSYLSSLLSQLPLFLVYLGGLYWVRRQRPEQPWTAKLATWALGLLLLEEIAGLFITQWLIDALNNSAVSGIDTEGGILLTLLNSVDMVRMLLHSAGIALLIRALFPNRPNSGSSRWLRRVIGGMAGLILGLLVALIFGDGIGAILNISTFEGERGFFVAFIMLPGLALVGTIIGALVGGRWRSEETPAEKSRRNGL